VRRQRQKESRRAGAQQRYKRYMREQRYAYYSRGANQLIRAREKERRRECEARVSERVRE